MLATEAFVSFPFRSDSQAALAVNSHFYEFIELDSHKIKLAHELELGQSYSVIVTTSGGFYRYELNDMVVIIGFINQCPTLRFIGKAESVVDMFGEKLNENHVNQIVTEQIKLYDLQPTFWMMAPEQVDNLSGRYTMFLQFKTNQLSKEVMTQFSLAIEEKLRENYHYNYCRQLGQLHSLRTFIITSQTDATQTYLQTCNELGQRLGNIKPTCLHSFTGWGKIFSGQFI